MKKTFTAKITLGGIAIGAINEFMVKDLIINSLNEWLREKRSENNLKNKPQLISLHKVQVVKEEIDTE